MSVLARVNYNYKKRYYLTLTGRYDGSSNFAANHKWGFFPSAAVKWSISNEYFMRRVRWIEELSLRVSAGRTGNDAIKPYRSIEAYTSTSGGYLLGGTQSTAFYPTRVASDNLTWETTDLYNAAIDALLFKKRLNITFEGYISKTRDLLLSVQKAAQSGFPSHFENIGRTSNKGLELTVETRNIVKPKFSWSTSLTLSHNKQQVEDIGSEDFVSAMNSPGNSQYMMYGYVKGRPLNALWGFKYGGVWHNQEEIERNKVTNTYVSATTSLSPGLPRYIDTNNDGVINDDDKTFAGSYTPKNTFSFGGSLNWKGFDFSFFFQGVTGNKVYNGLKQMAMNGRNDYGNLISDVYNSWDFNPQGSKYPRLGLVTGSDTNGNYSKFSDIFLEDGDYLRLKNITLGYTLPKSVSRFVGMENGSLRVYISVDNVCTITGYSGVDPEVGNYGIDRGVYPVSRFFNFGVNINF